MSAPLLKVSNHGGSILNGLRAIWLVALLNFFLQLVSLLAAELMHGRRCSKNVTLTSPAIVLKLSFTFL